MRLHNTTESQLRLILPQINLYTDLAPGESMEIDKDKIPALKSLIEFYKLKITNEVEVPQPKVEVVPEPQPSTPVEPIQEPIEPDIKVVEVETPIEELILDPELYTRDELYGLTKAQLYEVLSKSSIVFSGSKEELVNKILESKLKRPKVTTEPAQV